MAAQNQKSNNKYVMYYDESNNMRSLILQGGSYNIDNDPTQDSSPIFVLAGIAHPENGKSIDYNSVHESICLQKSSTEIKLRTLVKIRAKMTSAEAFNYALGNKNVNSILKWIEQNEISIHYQMINTSYWTFLDIIEDLIFMVDGQLDFGNQFYYKDCLYQLMKADKNAFLSLMSAFEFPRIRKNQAYHFLKALYHLTQKSVANSFKMGDRGHAPTMLLHLGLLFYKCLHLPRKKIEFTLVFEREKNILVDDFSIFYLDRIKTFPNATHIFDEELKIEKKIKSSLEFDQELRDTRFQFVSPPSKYDLPLQLADVIAGITRLYFRLLEESAIGDEKNLINGLNPMQKKSFQIFKDLLDRSADECPLFLHRIIVPIDEHKASLLMSDFQ